MVKTDYVDIELSDPRVAFVEAQPSGWAGEVTIGTLAKALEERGVPAEYWPYRPTAAQCLARAVHRFTSRVHGTGTKSRILVRPLAKSQGWSIVVEDPDHLDLEATTRDPNLAHQVELTCRLEKSSGTRPKVHCTPSTHVLIPLILSEFDRYYGVRGPNKDMTKDDGLFVASEDLSRWFSQTIIKWVRGVATRPRGGSYFVMRDHFENLQKAADALEQASVIRRDVFPVEEREYHRHTPRSGGYIVIKPEFKTIQAIEIMLEAISKECQTRINNLTDNLHNGGLGQGAIESRKDEATEIYEKLVSYEDLMGFRLEDIRTQLSRATEALGVAAMAAL